MKQKQKQKQKKVKKREVRGVWVAARYRSSVSRTLPAGR
mgnify:CR=1 FL=1